MSLPLAVQVLREKIYLIRGRRVMLDRDLASLYGVATKNLNKAVSRNRDRFPVDFMFELTREEHHYLRFQFGTLEKGRHSKYLPRVLAEQGVAMLSSVLRSARARQVNIAIVRTVVRTRQVRCEEEWGEHAPQIREIFEAMRALAEPSPDEGRA
jgi:hypothetical protein